MRRSSLIRFNSNSNSNSNRIITIFRCLDSNSNVRYKPIINGYSYNQKRLIVSSRIISSSSSSKGDNNNNNSSNNIQNDSIISNNESKINNSNPNPNPSTKINPSVAENIGSTAKNYTFELNKVYMEAEKNLMIRINETNSRRFRLIFFSSLFGITIIVFIFGKKIRKALAKETAGFAKETLENESLKIQTQELAMAVVQTVLNDKDITAHAATFLQDAATVPATQEALLKLALHILQHPDSLNELSKLCAKVVANLSVDNDSIKNVAELFTSVFQDEKLKSALLELLVELSKDEELVKVISSFVVTLMSRPEINEVIKKLLMTSTQTVLQDEEIINKSKEFVTDVMGDDAIQREGGDALLNTVTHALKPGIIRIAGAALVAVSIAFAKILLSPY